MKRRLRIVLLASCMISLFCGLGATAFAEEKVLTISLSPGNAGQDSFNPFTTDRTSNIYYLVYDRLVEMGADGIVYPHLL